MAKYKLQEMPDMNESGKRKVYPKMVINRTLYNPQNEMFAERKTK